MNQQQLETNKNEDTMRRAISTMKQRLGVIEQGAVKRAWRRYGSGESSPQENVSLT